MPFRAPKMYGFIFGFQRLVWCPKWTPASSRFFMLTSVIRLPYRLRAIHPFLPDLEPTPNSRKTRRDAILGSRGSRVHRIEELLIRLRPADLVVQEFHGFDGVQLREELAQDPHPVQHLARDEELLLPGARPRDVHGREHALVHQAPVEVDLHVAGALEFLEDHLVHPAAGVDERGAHDGEATAVLDVARRAEEFLRPA